MCSTIARARCWRVVLDGGHAVGGAQQGVRLFHSVDCPPATLAPDVADRGVGGGADRDGHGPQRGTDRSVNAARSVPRVS